MVTIKSSSTSEDSEPPSAPISPVISRIFKGEEYVQSFQNSSQYRGGGVSSCGLAALNCARIAFQNGKAGSVRLLQALLASETTDDILMVSDMWSGSTHLEVEELVQLPLFARSLKPVETRYGAVNKGSQRRVSLARLVQLAQAHKQCILSVITRPPEILLCLKIELEPHVQASSTGSRSLFVIFDSHPRPSHPRGAGWLFSRSAQFTARHLYTILAVDSQIFDDPNMQWQAQLLNHFSATIVVPLAQPRQSAFDEPDVKQLVWDTSFRILNLQTELADAKARKETLESINKAYEDEQDKLRVGRRVAQRKIEELEAANKTLLQRLRAMNPPHPHAEVSGKERVSDTLDVDFLGLSQREIQEQHDHMNAIQRQRQYDNEALQIEQERLALAAVSQVTFTCGVCLDVTPDEDLALVEKCQHQFCRECLQNYVLSKISDRRFPIVCPTCMSDKALTDPGIVEHNLIEQMNISPKDYEILEEMMLSRYCIPVHCSKCSQTAFVDREEYQEQSIVTCPLPGCTHAWCKNCTQTIEPGGPQHSCDGSNELASLMKKQGWKACPGCKTNIQKTDGCNHMTCPSPGCNMHFCYRCGQAIIQSALRSDVNRAISGHYRVCHLIEDVPDAGVAP
ncbi:hypothetical protein BDP27DRAFT_1229708 [Rhodocollybia butyracea]|uniref:Uncharacterized protein n=1 Tax=Rhodocollybia butyracea TaxID=206335 RepID=A0A9P5U2Q0_9AGAR|nr:hypothetical protein BDP27DRAFT_1229708 [Rhodocollybia butyracea]